MERVRDLRDTFVDLVLANSTDGMVEGEELLRGTARFVEPDLLDVDGERIHAHRTVVASGSHAFVPEAWKSLGERLLTSDSLFDMECLPDSVAVMGMGPIGLEIGQALHRLGVSVTGFDSGGTIGRMADPEVNSVAIETLGREIPLHLGKAVEISATGDGVGVRCGAHDISVQKLFAAVGRIPNIPEGLASMCETDARGVPRYDRGTLRIGQLPVFIAGDAMGERMMLQDAAEEGRVAGANATRETPLPSARKVPMFIVFSDPNIAEVGARFDEVTGAVVGRQRFGPVGRALIMGRYRGLIRLYAEPDTGRLLGGAMVGPRVEHLAHLVAWSVQQRLSVEDMLGMPFYHLVIEEALQDALKDTCRRLSSMDSFRPAVA